MLPPEATPFFAEAGFQPFKNILLLEGDGHTINVPHRREAPGRLRRFRGEDLEGVLRVDASAFDQFWKLDAWSVRSISRYCDLNNVLVTEEEGEILGYCIAGTNRYCGFIQRLAVRRDQQGRGWGKALLLEQVAWLKRKGARVFLVNTQEENSTAQRMYREMGFSKSVALRHIYRYEHDED
jgi:ribosomal-protein-alanine N-acetyltransferase